MYTLVEGSVVYQSSVTEISSGSQDQFWQAPLVLLVSQVWKLAICPLVLGPLTVISLALGVSHPLAQ